MLGDTGAIRSYVEYMAGGLPHIILNIDVKQPVEIGDFVSVFTALSSQYEKFMRANYPDLSPDADIYVTEVRKGSIEADLLPWALASLPAIISVMDQMQIVENFIRAYGNRLSAYFAIGGRDKDANSSDLKDFMGAVRAIANDPNGAGTLEAVTYEDDKKQVRAAIKFSTKQAKTAVVEIEAHRRELEKEDSAQYKRVLMTFRQSNIKDTELGKRTGERVLIEDISDKDLALIYASDLAEQRIKHEIREADDNVYKKGFIVDADVEIKGGKPIAYRITHVHQVIELPDED